MTGSAWFPTLSNIWFFIPSYIYATQQFHTTAALFFLMAITSAIHHLCLGAIVCLLPATLARKQDFFFAQLLIVVTALFLVKFPRAYRWVKRWIILIVATLVFVVEVYLEEPLILQIGICSGSVGIVLIYWIIHYSLYARLPEYRWRYLSTGIGFMTVAGMLFVVQTNTPDDYDWIHGIWHMLSATGEAYIALSRRKPRDPYAVLDKPIQKRA